MPYWTDDDPVTAMTAIAAAPEKMNVLVWLGTFLTPCMIISMLTLGYVARRGAPVLATVGTVLSFGAYALWGATGNVDYTATVLFAAGYRVDEVVTLTGHLDATGLSMAVGTFWVLGHILGLVILAIALHRAGAAAVGRDGDGVVAADPPGRCGDRAVALAGRVRRLGDDHADLRAGVGVDAPPSRLGVGPAAGPVSVGGRA